MATREQILDVTTNYLQRTAAPVFADLTLKFTLQYRKSTFSHYRDSLQTIGFPIESVESWYQATSVLPDRMTWASGLLTPSTTTSIDYHPLSSLKDAVEHTRAFSFTAGTGWVIRQGPVRINLRGGCPAEDIVDLLPALKRTHRPWLIDFNTARKPATRISTWSPTIDALHASKQSDRRLLLQLHTPVQYSNKLGAQRLNKSWLAEII